MLEKVDCSGKDWKGKKAQLLTGGSLNSVKQLGHRPRGHSSSCLSGPALVGTGPDFPQRLPFPSGRDQYVVSGGLGGRVTMCYVDNVLAV